MHFRFGAPSVPTTAATFALDSAFVYGTSGDGYFIIFNSPKSQTNGALTVYVYCTAATGSPTSSSVDIFDSAQDGEDPQRPDAGASPLASSSNTDASGCTSASWLTYSISSVSLTAGNWYFLIVQNDTGTPASNNFTVQTRVLNGVTGASSSAQNYGQLSMRGGTVTDGFTTDGTINTSTQPPAAVITFADSAVIGEPFVTTANPASNTNYRGTRFNFDEDIKIAGASIAIGLGATNTGTLEVYNGSTQLATITLQEYALGNSTAAFFSSPITFPGGVDIDVVVKPGSNSTAGAYVTVGTSPPADVQAAASSSAFSYVNGATPGSFTETDYQFIPIMLTIDTNPAISGGGSSQIIGGGI